MIVCHCHGLTDRDIREAALRTHASRCEDLQAACPAATCCGGCRPLIEQILAQPEAEPRAAPAEDQVPLSGDAPLRPPRRRSA